MRTTPTPKPRPLDARTGKILKALRDAREDAVKSARMHGVPIVYIRNGRIVRERP
jgi:hypothetical protein